MTKANKYQWMFTIAAIFVLLGATDFVVYAEWQSLYPRGWFLMIMTRDFIMFSLLSITLLTTYGLFVKSTIPVVGCVFGILIAWPALFVFGFTMTFGMILFQPTNTYKSIGLVAAILLLLAFGMYRKYKGST